MQSELMMPLLAIDKFLLLCTAERICFGYKSNLTFEGHASPTTCRKHISKFLPRGA
jgi:hypothetical protein